MSEAAPMPNNNIVKYCIQNDETKYTQNLDSRPKVPFNAETIYEDFYRAISPDDPAQVTYVPTFAEVCAKRVCGRHNKNVIITILGKQGDGKSNAALNIAISAAKWIAKIKGGRPSDYFNMRDNLATIDPNMLHDMMKELKKLNIYILDDAGPGWDSRNSMSDRNKHLNYILQTARPSNNIIIVTTIHQKMVDVTVRRLSHFVVISEEVMHNIGKTYFSVKAIQENQLFDKIYYKYTRSNGYCFVRHCVDLAPKNLLNFYDQVREEKQLLVQERYEEMKKGNVDAEPEDRGPTKHEIKTQEYITKYGDAVLQQIQENNGLYSIANALGIPNTQVVKIAKNFGFTYSKKQWRGVL